MKRLFLLSALFCVLFAACEPPQVRYDIPGPIPKIASPRIAPLPRGTPSLKFLVFGDWGGGGSWRTGSNYRQRQVATGMASVIKRKDRGANFVIGVGDNFYPSGVEGISDRAWRTTFEEVYDPQRFPMTFYMILGNHDYGKDPMAQVKYHQLKNKTATGRWYMPDQYYTFLKTLADSTVVQFFALDTQILIEDNAYRDYRDRTQGAVNESEQQMAWLTTRLAESQARWKIVLMHHPVFSNGHHGDTAWLISRLKPLFERYHVNAVFSGHEHHLEALEPVNGVHYFVSGAAANTRDVTWRENTLFAYADVGFTWCRITRDKLLVVMCDKNGRARWEMPIVKERAIGSSTR